MELINALGLNVKILLAQLVNFAILLFVIYKYAYGPIMKVLDERQEKIEKGISDAVTAGARLTEITEKEKEVLATARKQAQEIVSKAELIAMKNKEELIIAAKEQSQKILADAEKKIEMEKNKMMQEVKGQIAELVVTATGKVIGEKIDADKDKDLINKSLK